MKKATAGEIAPMEEGSGLKPIFGKKAERDSCLSDSRVCPRRCSYKNQIAKVGRDSSQMDGAKGVSKGSEQGGETALFGIGVWVLLCS